MRAQWGRAVRVPRRLRRVLRLSLAVACVALGLAAGSFFHSATQAEYEARATILVLPTTPASDSGVSGVRGESSVSVDTEAEVLRSATVAQAAAENLDGRMSAEALQQSLTVTVPSNSQVLVAAVRAPSALTARDAANALATAYLTQRRQSAEDQLRAAVTALTAQREDAGKRLTEVAGKLAGLEPTDAAGRALLEAQRAVVVEQLGDINNQLLALDVQDGLVRGGRIVSRATVPTEPVTPGLLLLMAAGGGLGLLAGTGVLLLRRPGRAAEPGHEVAGSPVPSLGAVRARVSTGAHPEPDLGELRRLCLKIAGAQGGWPVSVIGLGDPEARARFCAALGHAWATEFGGAAVVLTSAPAQLPDLVPTGQAGLLDAIEGTATPLDAVTLSLGTYCGVMGLGAGSTSLPASALRDLLPAMWSVLVREFGAVFIEAGSPLDSSLAQAVTQTAGQLVIAVDETADLHATVEAALEEIDWLSCADRVLGTVRIAAGAYAVPGDPGSDPVPDDPSVDQEVS